MPPMDFSSPSKVPQRAELSRLIDEALTIADALGNAALGILLNDALIASSGAGRAPPGRL